MRPFAALALALVVPACSGSDSSALTEGPTAAASICAAGDTRECACPGGAGVHGAQACETGDGSASWSACACHGDGPDDAGVEAEADAGEPPHDAVVEPPPCSSPEACGCEYEPMAPVDCSSVAGGGMHIYGMCSATPDGCTAISSGVYWCCR